MNFLENVLAAEKILNVAINSLSILFIGWILTKLFRKKAAPLRSEIILMVIVILLILPILNLSVFVPGIPSFRTVLQISLSRSSSLPEEMMGPATINTKNSRSASAVSSSGMVESIQKIWKIYAVNRSNLPIIQIINSLGIMWILGSFFLFMKLMYGCFSLKKFKKGLVEIRDRRILQNLKAAERSFKHRPRTTILSSRQINSPLALGLFKPMIILPQYFCTNMNSREIKGILLHELSHIYHRDQITGILQRFAVALFWWNPFVHMLNADFSRAREEISDNHVLLENDKIEYAECLIDLAERTSHISRLPVTTGMASPHFPLKDRVTNILSKERIMETKLKKSTTLVIVLVSLFVLGTISGHRLTFASAEKAIKVGLEVKNNLEIRAETDPEPSIKAEPPTIATPLSDSQEKADKPKLGKRIIVKPKLVKKVDPVYPDEAAKQGLEGVVVIEGVTDENGKVIDTKILKGAHELLNDAAVDAVKQWEYKPFIINGKPIPVEFTTTLRFTLEDKVKTTSTDEVVNAGVHVDVLDLPEDVELKLIKRVEPKYPEEALKKHIGGKVVLKALIDKDGNVVNAKVVESENEILNDAAIGAVRQWKYEPYRENGNPKKVRYKVTLDFKVR